MSFSYYLVTVCGAAHAAVDWAVHAANELALFTFEGSPLSQPVIDSDYNRVFEKFREDHEEDHEEATRGQVTAAHLRKLGLN